MAPSSNIKQKHANPTTVPQSTIRSVGDGATAIAAFGDALNKPDFSDVTFKVSFSSSSSSENTGTSSSVSGKKYPSNNNNNKKSTAAATAKTTNDVIENNNTADEIENDDDKSVTTIYAHRAILAARSPVFRQMFFGGFPEAKQKEVSVVDEFKPEHFMTVLEWAYTGRAEMSAKDVLGVLRCANFYGFDDLVVESRDLAQSFIDEENVLHLLEHASSLGESTLVYQCLNFIKCHAHSVLTSPVWLSVSPECVERVLQLPAIDCEEALLFEQALCWLETNTTLRADLVEADRRKEKEERQRLKEERTRNSMIEEDEQQQHQENDGEEVKSSNEEADAEEKEQDEEDNEDEGEEDRERRAVEEALLDAAQNAPYQSAPLVRRFFKLLRLSHLSVGHLLDRVRPLLGAHSSIRPDYVSALEFLVDPGRLSEVSQVPRAPTVLSTVQVDVPSEFLRGWRLVAVIPQSQSFASANWGASSVTQALTNNFFSSIPHHASYICVGEMALGRDDLISIIAVGTVRMVRPIINSRSPVVAEEGDIMWHASPNSFGFTPKQQQSSGGGPPSSSSVRHLVHNNIISNSSVVSGMPGRSFNNAGGTNHQQQQQAFGRSSNQSAGVRFVVAAAGQQQVYPSSQQQNNNNSRDDLSSISPNQNNSALNVVAISNSSSHSSVDNNNQEVRIGKRFIYYK